MRTNYLAMENKSTNKVIHMIYVNDPEGDRNYNHAVAMINQLACMLVDDSRPGALKAIETKAISQIYRRNDYYGTMRMEHKLIGFITLQDGRCYAMFRSIMTDLDPEDGHIHEYFSAAHCTLLIDNHYVALMNLHYLKQLYPKAVEIPTILKHILTDNSKNLRNLRRAIGNWNSLEESMIEKFEKDYNREIDTVDIIAGMVLVRPAAD